MASTQGIGASKEKKSRSAGNGSRQKGPRDAQRTLVSLLKGSKKGSMDFLPMVVMLWGLPSNAQVLRKDTLVLQNERFRD